ncbi:MAG: response regulator transcription factor [Halanaerobiales bacterium]|nr:response regulator transcription factor [Halanaerobiales bacterium]
MAKQKVLIIDDDQHICKILMEYFQFEGYDVITANDGKSGLEKVENEKPDLIVLDIMLPKMDGWEVCKELRPQNNIPIIMLSAKSEEDNRINGLQLGADDYVTKPFSPKEVVLRAKSILRRVDKQKETKNKKLVNFPHLKIDKNSRGVEVDQIKIDLTPKEFDLLWILVNNPNKVFTRQELLNKVWGYDYFGDIRTIDTHIKSLRKKLGEPIERYIKTVWGVGYKFENE